MADISAAFRSRYSESRLWVIWDLGRDPNAPPEIFRGYLDPDADTGWLTLQGAGLVLYQRSDGSATRQDNIRDGDTVDMS
jgi:hypothetical protein